MKISEFRKLIREEVRKIVKEAPTSVIEKLQVSPKKIGVNYDEAEGLLDAVKAKHKLGKEKYVAGEGGEVSVYKIGTIPYVLVDEDGFGVIFKETDLPKIVRAIKDGSYFDWN